MYKKTYMMRLIDGSAFSDQLLSELKFNSKALQEIRKDNSYAKSTFALSDDRKNIIVESYYEGEFVKAQFPKDSYEKMINLLEWYKFLGNAGIQTFSMTYEEINDQDTNNA